MTDCKILKIKDFYLFKLQVKVLTCTKVIRIYFEISNYSKLSHCYFAIID